MTERGAMSTQPSLTLPLADPLALIDATALFVIQVLIAQHPELLVEKAIWGMVPHNRLGRRIITKLKVYAGAEHPHTAQNPELLTFAAAK